eukprot:gene37325-50498_t
MRGACRWTCRVAGRFRHPPTITTGHRLPGAGGVRGGGDPYLEQGVPPGKVRHRRCHTYRAEAALALQRRSPLVDGHNDLPWRLREVANNAVRRVDLNATRPELHTDVPRLREGEVGRAGFPTPNVWVPCAAQGRDAVRMTLEQIDVVHKVARRYPEAFAVARSAADVGA